MAVDGRGHGKAVFEQAQEGVQLPAFYFVNTFINRIRVRASMIKGRKEGDYNEQVAATLAARKQHVEYVIAGKKLLHGGGECPEGVAERGQQQHIVVCNSRRHKMIDKLE